MNVLKRIDCDSNDSKMVVAFGSKETDHRESCTNLMLPWILQLARPKVLGQNLTHHRVVIVGFITIMVYKYSALMINCPLVVEQIRLVASKRLSIIGVKKISGKEKITLVKIQQRACHKSECPGFSQVLMASSPLFQNQSS